MLMNRNTNRCGRLIFLEIDPRHAYFSFFSGFLGRVLVYFCIQNSPTLPYLDGRLIKMCTFATAFASILIPYIN